MFVLQRIDPQEVYPPAGVDVEKERQAYEHLEANWQRIEQDPPDLVASPDTEIPPAMDFQMSVSNPDDLPTNLLKIYESWYGKP